MPSEDILFEICSYLKNWFDKNQKKYIGEIKIQNGSLVESYGLKPNQYFRLMKSTLNNDGIYIYPTTQLTDEVFSGAIWAMSFPKAFLKLCDEIQEWKSKYEGADKVAMSPFSSESVPGVYSYSKTSGGGDTVQDRSGTWQGVFGAKLAPYRKM